MLGVPRPDEADLELGSLPDHRAEAGNRLGRRLNIGDRRRNGFERRVQQMRQARKRGLKIGRGRLVILELEPGHGVSHERAQGSWYVQNQPCARFAQDGQVAAKLDSVAVALLGVNEHALALRIAAIPRGQELGSRRAILDSEAPLIMRKSLREISAQEVAHAEVSMGLAMRRIERERLFPMGLGMIKAGELMEGVGEIHMSRGGLGRECYDLPQNIDRLLVFSACAKHRADPIESLGGMGLHGEPSPARRQGLIEEPGGAEHVGAAIEERISAVGRDRLPHERDRGGSIARILRDAGAKQQRFWVKGLALEYSAAKLVGFRQTAGLAILVCDREKVR
jgi:hypothetical protein